MYIHTYIYMYTYACMHADMHTYIHAYIHVHTHTYTYASRHLCACVHVLMSHMYLRIMHVAHELHPCTIVYLRMSVLS